LHTDSIANTQTRPEAPPNSAASQPCEIGRVAHQPQHRLCLLASKSIAHPTCAGKLALGADRLGLLGNAYGQDRRKRRPQGGGVALGRGRRWRWLFPSGQAGGQAAFGPQEPQERARESVGRLGKAASAGRTPEGSAKPGAHTATGGREPSTCPVYLLGDKAASRSCGGFSLVGVAKRYEV
jgi:hypothetical protein